MKQNEYIVRKRISKKFKILLSGGIGFLIAPAGYGKSVFVKQWLQENEVPAIWLNLSCEDNSPEKFLDHFTNSIKSAGFDTTALELLIREGWQSLDKGKLISQLFSMISSQKSSRAIIIDDFQTINDKEVIGIVDKLISKTPRKSIIIIISRTEPPFSLVNFRLNQQLVEIRKDYLAFSLDEGSAFFQLAPTLQLSNKGLRKIHRMTEGWPAGFRYIKHALNSSVMNEDDIFIYDTPYIKEFLLEEVFTVQSKQLKEFLTRTSLLGKFSPDLCDYVFNRSDALSLISELEKNHIFIEKIENTKHWYRYHNLFADLLKEQRRSVTSQEKEEIRVRAGEWYEANKDWKQALEFYFQSNSQTQFIQLLNHHIAELFINGWYSKIKEWLDEISPDNLFGNYELLAYLALSNIMLGNQQAGKDILDSLENSSIQEDDFLSYMVDCGNIYLLYFDHKITEMLVLANRIVGKQPKGLESWNAGVELILAKGETVMGQIASSNARLNGILSFSLRKDLPLLNLTASIQMAINYIHLGDLGYAKTTCEKYIRQNGWKNYPLIGALFAIRGDIQREKNNLTNSQRDILQAREYISQVGGIGIFGWIELAYFRIQYALNNLQECENILENLDFQLRSADAPPWLWDGLIASKIKLWVAQQEFERIENYVKEEQSFLSGEVSFSNFQSHLEFIHFLTLKSRNTNDIELVSKNRNYLEQAIRLASGSKWIDLLIRCEIEKAILESSIGNFQDAYDALEHALKIGSLGGYFRIFLENWEYLHGLFIRENLSMSRFGYLRKIIEAATNNNPSDDILKMAPPNPLTAKELDILRRLDSVYSIPEIAEMLGVAPSTVRSHVKHIFSKLSVHSRIEAVHAAKELNIL